MWAALLHFMVKDFANKKGDAKTTSPSKGADDYATLCLSLLFGALAQHIGCHEGCDNG